MSTRDVVVRPAGADEWPLVVAATVAAYGQYVDRPDGGGHWAGYFARELAVVPADPDAAWRPFLAVAPDGTLAGAVRADLGSAESEAWVTGDVSLRMLAVVPAFRGLGIAERLVAAVEELARAEGRAAVSLHTAPDLVPAAERLYARLGYVRDPAGDFEVAADGGVGLAAWRRRV